MKITFINTLIFLLTVIYINRIRYYLIESFLFTTLHCLSFGAKHPDRVLWSSTKFMILKERSSLPCWLHRYCSMCTCRISQLCWESFLSLPVQLNLYFLLNYQRSSLRLIFEHPVLLSHFLWMSSFFTLSPSVLSYKQAVII